MSSKSGNFRNREAHASNITFSHFQNPFNFYTLMFLPMQQLISWLMDNRLLKSMMMCEKCGEECKLSHRKDKIDDFTWRCRNIKQHHDRKDFERSIRQYSFFHHSHFTIQDIFVFIISFLQKQTLLQCSKLSGIDYKRSSVDWANFIREIFKQYVYECYQTVQLEGEVEIDESLFGKKCKFNRGNPHTGLKVWVFGMVERGTNKLLLFSVLNRTKEILIPIISKFVKAGSRIFSDGWSSYCDLNTLGFEHFTVIHKQSFLKKYRNKATGETITVHTNTIEGAWSHAKKTFYCYKWLFAIHFPRSPL